MAKPLCIVAVVAVMSLTSCVVNDSTGYMRTPDNIAGICSRLVDKTIVESLNVLDAMSEEDRSSVAHEYSDAVGLVLTITPDGQDSWTVEASSDEYVFSFNARCEPDEIDGFLDWTCTAFICEYCEKDGFSVALASEGDVFFEWAWRHGQGQSTYCLEHSGSYHAEFMHDTEFLDWCELVYNRDELRYRTSQGR